MELCNYAIVTVNRTDNRRAGKETSECGMEPCVLNCILVTVSHLVL